MATLARRLAVSPTERVRRMRRFFASPLRVKEAVEG